MPYKLPAHKAQRTGEGTIISTHSKRPEDTAFSKRHLDYITYDFQKHILTVGIAGQRLSYLGLPESVYLYLSLSQNRERIFMEQIFNRYPVVIEHEKVSSAVRRRRRAAQKRSDADSSE